jgi:hypothetical protein
MRSARIPAKLTVNAGPKLAELPREFEPTENCIRNSVEEELNRPRREKILRTAAVVSAIPGRTGNRQTREVIGAVDHLLGHLDLVLDARTCQHHDTLRLQLPAPCIASTMVVTLVMPSMWRVLDALHHVVFRLSPWYFFTRWPISGLSSDFASGMVAKNPRQIVAQAADLIDVAGCSVTVLAIIGSTMNEPHGSA